MTALSARYHAAALAKDVQAILAEITDGIRMHSPTKMKPFEGKPIVAFLFGHLMEVLQDFRFGKIVETGDTAVLFFTCRIGDRDAEGCDVLTFNAEGKIDDFRVLIRPLRAVEALNEEMGRRVARYGQSG